MRFNVLNFYEISAEIVIILFLFCPYNYLRYYKAISISELEIVLILFLIFPKSQPPFSYKIVLKKNKHVQTYSINDRVFRMRKKNQEDE